MSYRKIFVVGCPRSGTSWISQLIGIHPDVLAGTTESQAYPMIFEPFQTRKYQTLRARFKNSKAFLAQGSIRDLLFGFPEQKVWDDTLEACRKNADAIVGVHAFVTLEELQVIVTEVSQQTEGDALVRAQKAIEMIFDCYWRKNRQNESVFIEKTPLHIRQVEQILSSFPDSLVVEVVRDGRDVDVSRSAMATNPANAWAKGTTEEKINLWLECIRLGDELHANTSIAQRIHRVRFEDMRVSPQETLAELFQFCQLDTSHEQRDAILATLDIQAIPERREGHFVRSGAVGQWQQKLSADEIQQWDNQAGDVLDRVGYARPNLERPNA